MILMSFFPSMNKRMVPSLGRPNAKIAIVGDYTSPFDDRALIPFSGPAGTVLEQCLHAAHLIKGEVYITNTFKSKSFVKPTKKEGPAPDLFNEGKCQFTPAGMAHVEALRAELNSVDANVFVACGPAAFAALCGLRSISKYRGYVFPSKGLSRIRKVIPTHHPTAAMRGMYTYRHMIVADLQKAKIQSYMPELIRPERQLVYDYASVEEALQWLEYYEKQEIVSADIEVVNFEIACISFSSSPDLGCVIPIGNTQFRPQGWTEDEEAMIWRGIQKVLGNPRSEKVFQNGIFDMQFMLANSGVVVRGHIRDTMIGHSVMFPELPKGLGFLGSIYCGAQQYWKDTVKFTNIKEES
jgi:uracil-DNA glycosylase family 4